MADRKRRFSAVQKAKKIMEQYMEDNLNSFTESTSSEDRSTIPSYSSLELLSTVGDESESDGGDNTNEPSNDSSLLDPTFATSTDELDEEGDVPNVFANLINDTAHCSSLREKLQYWAITHGITHSALREILKILHTEYPNLPLDPKTLLASGTVDGVIPLDGGGFYYHFGAACGITKWAEFTDYNNTDINLQFNIDGLPIFRSSKLQFWPILAMVISQNRKSKPFIVGLFMGNKKPPINFLNPFVTEMKDLLDNGLIVAGRLRKISISSFVCDMPARCFVKQCKLYSGYEGCDKCTQTGVYDGRMTYPETDAPLRTDVTFRGRDYPRHHIGDSQLETLPIDMVDAFPIDYMHNVLLGCMKKLLNLWTKGPLKNRISAANKDTISASLISLCNSISSDFNRRPRGIDESDYWKSTEWRTFLLYTGCVVLKPVLKPELYDNFAILCVAIRLLLTPTEKNIDTAQILLENFVKDFTQIYGAHSVVYNIHALVHLPSEVRKHGSLESFSAFPFENFLGQIKSLIRGSKHVMQQIIRRVQELNALIQPNDPPALYPLLRKHHAHGPLPVGIGEGFEQYAEIKLENFILDTKRNKCVAVDSKIVIIKNILKKRNNIFIVYQRFQTVENLFKYPTKSKNVGIYKISGLKNILLMSPIDNVTMKFTLFEYKKPCIPFKNAHTFVAVSIIHSPT